MSANISFILTKLAEFISKRIRYDSFNLLVTPQSSKTAFNKFTTEYTVNFDFSNTNLRLYFAWLLPNSKHFIPPEVIEGFSLEKVKKPPLSTS
jgi:hypothetical protein